MIPARKISVIDHPWLVGKSLTRLLEILNFDGLNARMVGGCVRDSLLERNVADIDLACCLSPQETMKRLEMAGIKVIPTGIKHGTITVIIAKDYFEITSLRRDVESYGRHAKVAFIDDWDEDARRRDFTINALYLDQDGSLYDPCCGLEDIAFRRVRFIGEAGQRIKEDALRILRFFRLSAEISHGHIDSIGLRACIRHQDMINNLSGERLAQEMFKILQAENLLPVIKVMADNALLDKIIPGHNDLKDFNDYVRIERKLGRCDSLDRCDSLGRCDSLARLACLLPTQRATSEKIVSRLRLSRKQVDKLKNFCRHNIIITTDIGQKDIRRAVYLFGRDNFIFALLQHQAQVNPEGAEPICGLDYALNWTIPAFPLLGRDLITVGLEAGPGLGKTLKYLEQTWLESDFSLTKNQLINCIPIKAPECVNIGAKDR